MADSSCKSAQIGRYFMRTEHEQQEGDFQQDECDDCEYFRVEMLVQSACEESHEGDAEVYDAAQQAQFELIHPEILLHLGGAGGQDAVV